jgi:histidine triad (HIT) family protein
MDCIFCKIAQGEIPSTTLYEDDDVRVILDINPLSLGHALVMPKAHYETILECPADLQAKLIQTAAAIGSKLEKNLHADGINILTNIRPGAGQSVPHAHIHVIPRYTGKPEIDHFSFCETPIENPDHDKVVAALQD